MRNFGLKCVPDTLAIVNVMPLYRYVIRQEFNISLLSGESGS
ncbi:MAG TPA: hypothetical protein VF268_12670 [Gammaproteobacteria bacterium]